MIDPTNKHPGAILPEDTKPITPHDIPVASSDDQSESAWAKMFPSGATKEELKAFINIYVQDMMREIRHADKKHKENIAKQNRELGGNY